MEKPTIIFVTSNGIGMGHLTRSSAIAAEIKEFANPIIVSMASGVIEVPKIAGVRFEYIPGRDRNWMGRMEWDVYLRERLVALIDETSAEIVSFDGVVPYPGVMAIKRKRPKVKIVWVRRGFWQNTTRKYLLTLQSKLMDLVITPGDYGQSYDNGPTSKRKDAVLVRPISIYKSELTLSREKARAEIGIDQNLPAILVQLGIGEADLNSKLTAALKGLSSWPNLQVVLTKEPITNSGENLAPPGLDIRIIKYFPLANVLKAFDAAICAAGYNSVHEELAAQIPTLFIPNTRGTDNQAARAKWTADNKMALTVDQSDLDAITKNAQKLAKSSLREELSSNCSKLPEVIGAKDVAKIYKELLNSPSMRKGEINGLLLRLKVRNFLGRGLKGMVYTFLKLVAYGYRSINPYKKQSRNLIRDVKLVENEDRDELHKLLKSQTPFEHIIVGASSTYKDRRIEIAKQAYAK
jgi:spore coat polysaccharide biosynthesis predicted glycosyltransferase SpsG